MPKLVEHIIALFAPPYLLFREPTAKGTGLAESEGKEDPVEIFSSPTLWKVLWGVAKVVA